MFDDPRVKAAADVGMAGIAAFGTSRLRLPFPFHFPQRETVSGAFEG